MLEKNSENSFNTHVNLFAPIEPYAQHILDTKDGHLVYYEECGNPSGIPVIVLHGGPGGGCNPNMRRYFDPSYYRIILFDQRGCGKSKPYASVDNNTTWHLIKDIELIRIQLEIGKFFIFGGSWGSTLGLLYAQKYPENVLGMILRGIFTMTAPELAWFYSKNGVSRFWPEAWREFSDIIPIAERHDLIKAYHDRLFGVSTRDQDKFAIAWTKWENSLATINSNGAGSAPPTHYARAFARIENHFFINKGFLDEDHQIMKNMNKISSIKAIIIQGRHDMICPPHTADELHSNWSNSKLVMIPASGHAMSEPLISNALIKATNRFRN